MPHIYIYIYIYIYTGCPFLSVTPNISLIFDFREKWFRHVLYGFEGAIRWCHWFDLEVIWRCLLTMSQLFSCNYIFKIIFFIFFIFLLIFVILCSNNIMHTHTIILVYIQGVWKFFAVPKCEGRLAQIKKEGLLLFCDIIINEKLIEDRPMRVARSARWRRWSYCNIMAARGEVVIGEGKSLRRAPTHSSFLQFWILKFWSWILIQLFKKFLCINYYKNQSSQSKNKRYASYGINTHKDTFFAPYSINAAKRIKNICKT